MGLFGKPQVTPNPDAGLLARIVAVEEELHRTQSHMRVLEGEQLKLHEQVRAWMRRAVAAERRADEARNQEPDRERPAAPAPPAPRSTPEAPWGARGRMLAGEGVTIRPNGADGG